MECDVVVIGAGMAGLIAARELGRGGCTVALLEAQDRVGGRLRQVIDARAAAPIELGGEFVHGRPEITYSLLREFGSTVVDNADLSFVYRDGALQFAGDDVFAAASDILTAALERTEDQSVDALIARHSGSEELRAAGFWACRLVSGFDAADTSLASARAIAQEWAGEASADGAQSRPIGGYAPLIAHLARSLEPARVELRMSTVVTHIAHDPAGVTVTARARDNTLTIRARRAIVTVPHGVLTAQPGALGAITFEPTLPRATNNAIAHIAMGPVTKVVLSFRTAFWETLNDCAWRDGAFFNGDEAFPTLWTQLPVRANTLVAWAGGAAAVRLANASTDELITRALASIGRYFGDTDAVENAFENAYVHDWQRDPFARGAYSYVLVGGETARDTLAASVNGRLWFAGEATAAGGEGGTVAGALQSGIRAAREILAER